MSNPFQQDMVTLKVPKGLGDMLSVGGYALEVDEKRCIVVPKKYVADLLGQGLFEVK